MWLKTYGELLDKFNGFVFVGLEEERVDKLLHTERVSFNRKVWLKHQQNLGGFFKAFLNWSLQSGRR